ncbi:MAG: hypothetical protein HY000_11030 [Planctomycetes bacterium]|nr:hypothetical protein [Planctomycetota bacterium]
MSRRRRETRTVDAGHGTARERSEFRRNLQFAAVLRRVQLVSAAVMLLGLMLAMIVLVGEFKVFWPIGLGGGLFVMGLLLFGLARPVSKWWTRDRS